MPRLRLVTSESLLPASSFPINHARLQFGRALKHTLNHDLTKCVSSRDPSRHADEDDYRSPRESSIGEKLFRTKNASLARELSDKSGVLTIKSHNHSQTKQDGSGSVKSIARLVYENQSDSEKKPDSENQDPARMCESSSASSQMLSDLGVSFKDKTVETSKKRKKPKGKKIPAGPNMSLLEELFPEEIGEAAATDTVDVGEEVVPRLPLVDFDDEDGFYNDGQNWKHSEGGQVERPNLEDALHEWDLAVLVVSRASKSLTESDFRRLVPRGQHIDEWRGPGDILKGELIQNVPMSIII